MEQLLILSHPDTAEIRQSIESTAKVVQEGSDKLLVIEGSADAIREATKLPGVTAADSIATEAVKKLSASEQAFLEAWRLRRESAATKSRIGDGLSWGSKGFKGP
jgi:hypothetical protein